MNATNPPDLREIARRLGGDLYANGRHALLPGPGHSPRDRSLSLSLVGDPPRLLWHSHAHDAPRLVWEYLGLAPEAGRQMTRAEIERERVKRQAEEARERARKLAFCREVWEGTQDAQGSPVATYLRARGITGAIPPTIRFHPAAPRAYPTDDNPRPATLPAMVAITTGPDGKSAAGLHVTYLRPDGRGKAPLASPRRIFGEMRGAVVQLGPVPEGDDLGIAEGIETALSYRDLTGATTWAAMSSSNLRHVSPPAGIARLVIAADGDAAGVEAAHELAQKASRKVACLVMPAPEGTDWNDALQEAAA